MVAWALCTNRNEVRHGKKRKDGKAVVYGAMDYLLEYQNCLDSPECPATSRPALWSLTPPPPPPRAIRSTWMARYLVRKSLWVLGWWLEMRKGEYGSLLQEN